MRKFKRKIGESYRPKFTKICYTGKGIQLEDGEGRVLRGKVFASEEEARAYATRMYGFCRNESSDLDDRDYEIGQKMQDFAKENIPEVRSVVTGSEPGTIHVMLNSDVYIMADEANEIAREMIRASGARGYRYVGLNKADPYIVLVNRSVRMNEAKKTMNRKRRINENSMWRRIDESKKKHVSKEEDNWYGIKGATFIYHGDWSDPEVEYKGVSLNYWAIQDGLWEVFKDENPEGTEKEFDKWMETHPEEVKSELELQYDAENGKQDDEPEEFDEGWLGDKMKAGWEKVKTGAKKVGKAIGDAFKGPFRKGDHIVMKGEDGEEFKGTITDYSMGDNTYEVMLGKPVNEDWDGRGLEEDVLDMPDRVEELENEIEKLWVRLGDVDEGTVMKLIAAYVELEQIEPGRVDF